MKKIAVPINRSQFLVAWSKEDERHRSKIDRLKSQLRAFQQSCSHGTTRFQEDPAGGNDSCYICTACDKVL